MNWMPCWPRHVNERLSELGRETGNDSALRFLRTMAGRLLFAFHGDACRGPQCAAYDSAASQATGRNAGGADWTYCVGRALRHTRMVHREHYGRFFGTE